MVLGDCIQPGESVRISHQRQEGDATREERQQLTERAPARRRAVPQQQRQSEQEIGRRRWWSHPVWAGRSQRARRFGCEQLIDPEIPSDDVFRQRERPQGRGDNQHHVTRDTPPSSSAARRHQEQVGYRAASQTERGVRLEGGTRQVQRRQPRNVPQPSDQDGQAHRRDEHACESSGRHRLLCYGMRRRFGLESHVPARVTDDSNARQGALR